jgi:Epoxide hydrolase N terminus
MTTLPGRGVFATRRCHDRTSRPIVDVPDAVLDDVARRLSSTVWPDDPNNEDWRYGVNAGYLRGLVAWRDVFDWRAASRKDSR